MMFLYVLVGVVVVELASWMVSRWTRRRGHTPPRGLKDYGYMPDPPPRLRYRPADAPADPPPPPRGGSGESKPLLDPDSPEYFAKHDFPRLETMPPMPRVKPPKQKTHLHPDAPSYYFCRVSQQRQGVVGRVRFVRDPLIFGPDVHIVRHVWIELITCKSRSID